MSAPESQVSLFKTVEDIIIPSSFKEDVFREGLSYRAKAGDIFIATFPKCGTTWTQMIVYLIRNKGKPPASSEDFGKKVPFLERTGLTFVENGNEPYGIKVHLPFDRIPYSEDAKYIYVARNPKDVVVSYFYHHEHQLRTTFNNDSFNALFEMFVDGKIEFGNFFDHVIGWYEHRADSNVLFLTYEEMKSDTRGAILKIGRFMDQKYGDMLEEEIDVLENVLNYSSLTEMKTLMTRGSISGPSTNTDLQSLEGKCIPSASAQSSKHSLREACIVREGSVGKWRHLLTSDQSQILDKELKSKLSGTELFEMWQNI